MANEDFESQLRRLVTGLADQEVKAGRGFAYDGGVMHADDVAEVALPSILCIAQDLSRRLGVGDFGYRFEMREPNPVFPLHAIPERPAPRFFEVAPFITEVFDGEVMDCRQDLALLFEAAAKLLRPEFNLDTHTNYTATTVAVSADDAPAPSLGR
ncbi:hypothetical protein [Denitromonas sp.]|uniref:hypothetical protein n=1 Tax=Denitromonas sp. TaxID=2734609 RepID=UPI002AFE3671|nr:hypothetical protein [Denitromonas sp.]